MIVHLNKTAFVIENIAAVRAIDDSHSAIYMVGGSPVDGGFFVEMAQDDILDAINNARYSHIIADVNNLIPAGEGDEED